ncbi:MAG TPA: hypothetical protein VED41_06855 [Solirubrobacteraceae bacterium]|nr:hypothetical protein [Solirubrobacteraceae bacterium]
MNTARKLAALVLGGLCLLAGCGASAPSKAQYTAKADAVCQAASAHTAPLIAQLTSAAESLSSGNQSAAQELASLLQQLHALAASTLAKLQALRQPSGGHAAIEQFMTPFATLTGALAQAAAAAHAGEPQQALPELANAAPASQKMTSAAKAYGLTQCETAFAALSSTAYTHPIHATLVGENHEPIVNRPWHYRVTVTDAQGQELSGTETTHYTFNGAVVGTEKPENVPFTNGEYRDTIEFPAEAVGYPLDVQTVIHTSLGTVTLEWPIKVRR